MKLIKNPVILRNDSRIRRIRSDPTRNWQKQKENTPSVQRLQLLALYWIMKMILLGSPKLPTEFQMRILPKKNRNKYGNEVVIGDWTKSGRFLKTTWLGSQRRWVRRISRISEANNDGRSAFKRNTFRTTDGVAICFSGYRISFSYRGSW